MLRQMFPLASVLVATSFAVAQAPLVSEESELQYDHTGLDVNDRPIEIDTAQVLIRNADSSINRTYDYTDVGQAGTTSLVLSPLVGGLAEGNYWVKVRVQAWTGVWSGWTPEVAVTLNRDVPTIPIPKAPPPASIDDTTMLEVEHDRLDSNGDALLLENLQVEIRNADLSVNRPVVIDISTQLLGTITVPLSDVVNGLADGEYTIRVSAQGVNGVWSQHSLPFGTTLSRSAPAAPTNVRF